MWVKKGFIFNSMGTNGWNFSGAMIPTPVIYDAKIIRVFLTFLDANGIGRPGYVDLNRNNLQEIVGCSKAPIFEIGRPGTFDENGSLVCSLTRVNEDKFYFYYAGFELGTKIRYRLLTGLAITDGCFRLTKKFETPVLDRTENELFFRCGPFCRFDNGLFRMWYVAGSSWECIDGKEMPVYEIRYLESPDGINWPNTGHTCIKIESDKEHGFGRPYVIFHNGIYKMFYSIRVKHLGYRMGYAESTNGKEWIRKDNEINLDVAGEGWDSEMVCYSSVIEIDNKLVMFYNGNGFGKTGFGYAEFEG